MGETSAAALRIVGVAARRLAKTQMAEKPLLDTWSKLIDYLTIDMAHLTVERVRVLYLDLKNRLIRDEHVADGSIDEASIHPREVIRRALDLGAAGMIWSTITRLATRNRVAPTSRSPTASPRRGGCCPSRCMTM
jgi:DNA repair protein RadC